MSHAALTKTQQWKCVNDLPVLQDNLSLMAIRKAGNTGPLIKEAIMSENEKAAARNIVEYLVEWDFDDEPTQDHVQAYYDYTVGLVSTLQTCYPPNYKLPLSGQRRWRNLEDAALEYVKSGSNPRRSFLFVDIFQAWLVKKYDLAESLQPPENLSPSEKKILDAIGMDPKTGPQIAEQTGDSETSVRRPLSQLVKRGLVKKSQDKKKKGYYRNVTT